MLGILGNLRLPFGHDRTPAARERRLVRLRPIIESLESRALLTILTQDTTVYGLLKTFYSGPGSQYSHRITQSQGDIASITDSSSGSLTEIPEEGGQILSYSDALSSTISNANLDDSSGTVAMASTATLVGWDIPDQAIWGTDTWQTTFRESGFATLYINYGFKSSFYPQNLVQTDPFNGADGGIEISEVNAKGITVNIATIEVGTGLYQLSVFPNTTYTIHATSSCVYDPTYGNSISVNGPSYGVNDTASTNFSWSLTPLSPVISLNSTALSSNSQTITSSYTVSGNNLASPAMIDYFWSIGPDISDEIGTTPAQVVTTKTAIGTYAASTSLASLGAKPANARYILAVVNSPSADPAHSIAAVELPDIAMTSAAASSNGKSINAAYTISVANLPSAGTIDFYWATGPDISDEIESKPVVKVATKTAVGTYTATTTIASLGAEPSNASDIIAVADSPSADPANNSAATPLPSFVLTSSMATSAANSSVSFTATVAKSMTSTPTGKVQFLDNGQTIGTATLGPTGVARLTEVFSSTTTTHIISGTYIGDSNYPSSTSNSLTQTVTAASPTGSWTSLTNPKGGPTSGTSSGNTSALMLLSDGTVMVEQAGINSTQSAAWYQLTPDHAGSYVNGRWSGPANMTLARLFFPTVMLPDGRVLAVGGEFTGPPTTPNTGETLNPPKGGNAGIGTWTSITPPPGSSNLGDVPMEVLSPTQVLIGDLLNTNTYLFDPTGASGLGTWSMPSSTPTKLNNDRSDEETWVKLPDGSILSYSIWSSITTNTFQAQRYITGSPTWISASTLNMSTPQSTPGLLSDPPLPGQQFGADNDELGPAFLLPQNGQVIYFGANGNTAYYDPSSGTWTAGPAEPTRLINGTYTQLAATDDPGAVLPNGDILLTLSPLVINPKFSQGTPAFIYEYNPIMQTFTDVSPGITTTGGQQVSQSAFQLNMLLLPSGQVLMGNSGGAAQIYTEPGVSAPQNAWRPVITGISGNSNGTFTLTGTQLNGLDEGSTYGDDDETASNYPIVQLTNNMSGAIYYARTSYWSSTGVATGSMPETVTFVPPTGLPLGNYSLAVIANGISSAGRDFSFEDVTSQIAITKSGLLYNRSTQLYGGTLTLTNTGTTPLTGLIEIQLTGLPAGVTLSNASEYAADGTPYIYVQLPTALAVGKSLNITVLFKNPKNIFLSYNSRVLGYVT